MKNRTLHHLTSRSIGRGFDGLEELPADLVNDPTFVRRLSFKGGELDWDSGTLAREIAEAPEEVAFFVDSSMWDLAMDPAVWKALLGRHDSVYVIPNVRMELADWVTRHPTFVPAKALTAESSLVDYAVPFTEANKFGRNALTYYVSLLQWRRRAASAVKLLKEQELGRIVSTEEVTAAVQRQLGQRGLLLVHKDGRRTAFDQWATDECLTYCAAEHGIRTGRPTVLLTKDHDILEQFYKLWWFLDTHYRAMLMADEYVADPFRHRHYPLPDVPMLEQAFDPKDGFLLDRGPSRMNAVLPDRFTFVAVECWILGRRLTRLTFGAEKEMHRLLEVKGQTGGLVSAGLRGRNLHPWLAPLPLREHLRSCAAVVYDRRQALSDGETHLALFDIWHAMNTHERFSHIVPEPPSSPIWTPSQTKPGAPWGHGR